jgi:putative acetyltransferase
MNDYRLRSATNADSNAIKALVFGVLREYGLQPDPDETDVDLNDIESGYLHAGGCFDVLVDSRGAIIGSVALYQLDSITCQLRKTYLSKQVRGQGQGRRLLEHALERAKELGFRRMVLETAPCSRKQRRSTENTASSLIKHRISRNAATVRTFSISCRKTRAAKLIPLLCEPGQCAGVVCKHQIRRMEDGAASSGWF